MLYQTYLKPISVTKHLAEESGPVALIGGDVCCSWRLFSWKQACCIVHIDETTDTIVEQDVEDFDLERFLG